MAGGVDCGGAVVGVGFGFVLTMGVGTTGVGTVLGEDIEVDLAVEVGLDVGVDSCRAITICGVAVGSWSAFTLLASNTCGGMDKCPCCGPQALKRTIVSKPNKT